MCVCVLGGGPDHSRLSQPRLMSHPGLLRLPDWELKEAGSSSGCWWGTGGPQAGLMGAPLAAPVPPVCPQ